MARRYDSRTTIFSPEGRLYQVRRKGEIETRRKRKRKEKRKVATARSLSLSLSLPPADPLRSKKRVFEKKRCFVSKWRKKEKRRDSLFHFVFHFFSHVPFHSTPLFFSSLLPPLYFKRSRTAEITVLVDSCEGDKKKKVKKKTDQKDT